MNTTIMNKTHHVFKMWKFNNLEMAKTTKQSVFQLQNPQEWAYFQPSMVLSLSFQGVLKVSFPLSSILQDKMNNQKTGPFGKQ